MAEIIRVEPANSNEPSVEIPPGGQWTMQFIVITVANRDDHGTLIAGSEHNKVQQFDGKRYLSARGVDWVLTAGPQGDPWQHELSFGSCWFLGGAATGSHLLDIAEAPAQGLPVEICP